MCTQLTNFGKLSFEIAIFTILYDTLWSLFFSFMYVQIYLLIKVSNDLLLEIAGFSLHIIVSILKFICYIMCMGLLFYDYIPVRECIKLINYRKKNKYLIKKWDDPWYHYNERRKSM